jgi:hypothetical protein
MKRRKKEQRKPQTGRVVGVAWYRPDQWQRLLEVAADSDSLHNTHPEWEIEATVRLQDLRNMGISVYRVDVDVEELLRWCNERDLELDGAARSRFVAEKLSSTAEE